MLRVSISRIETSISQSLDVSSASKLAHHPTPFLYSPGGEGEEGKIRFRRVLPLSGMCDFVWHWSLISLKVNLSDRGGRGEEGVCKTGSCGWVRLGVKTNYILTDVSESCRLWTDARSLRVSCWERWSCSCLRLRVAFWLDSLSLSALPPCFPCCFCNLI